MPKTARVDFAALLRVLISKGVSLADVATALDVSPGAPYRWLDGSEPLHSNGEALLIFYSRKVEIHHSEGDPAQIRARTADISQGEDDGRTDPRNDRSRGKGGA